MNDLIEITAASHNVLLDLRYATANNLMGEVLYKKPLCFLHVDAAQALQKAVILAEAQNYKVKIFDAFRPLEVQQLLYDKFPEGYVSNPLTGAIPHCRGVAVDITLVDEDNQELEMGTGFDNFTDKAHHGATGISMEVQRNRYILMGIMLTAGWDFYRNEWWHYQLFKPRDYAIIKGFDLL